MSKIVAQDIKNLGFVAEMFGIETVDFDGFLGGIISEQADLLVVRIGESAYASEASPVATLVKRAEKSLAAAELYQIRFNRLAIDIDSADGMDAFKLRRSMEKYLDEAEKLINRIASGAGTDCGDYAGGTLVTDRDVLREDT